MGLKRKLDKVEKICLNKLNVDEHTTLLETFKEALTAFCLLSGVIGVLVGIAVGVTLGDF